MKVNAIPQAHDKSADNYCLNHIIGKSGMG
jgi:hypothetical protein